MQNIYCTILHDNDETAKKAAGVLISKNFKGGLYLRQGDDQKSGASLILAKVIEGIKSENLSNALMGRHDNGEKVACLLFLGNDRASRLLATTVTAVAGKNWPQDPQAHPMSHVSLVCSSKTIYNSLVSRKHPMFQLLGYKMPFSLDVFLLPELDSNPDVSSEAIIPTIFARATSRIIENARPLATTSNNRPQDRFLVPFGANKDHLSLVVLRQETSTFVLGRKELLERSQSEFKMISTEHFCISRKNDAMTISVMHRNGIAVERSRARFVLVQGTDWQLEEQDIIHVVRTNSNASFIFVRAFPKRDTEYVSRIESELERAQARNGRLQEEADRLREKVKHLKAKNIELCSEVEFFTTEKESIEPTQLDDFCKFRPAGRSDEFTKAKNRHHHNTIDNSTQDLSAYDCPNPSDLTQDILNWRFNS